MRSTTVSRHAAGSGLALAAPASRTSAQATAEEYVGKLVFSYDDSPPEDYTKTFPVHQDEGVPACLAAVSGKVGSDDGISVEHLREIESAGWEVMSHTIEHRAMGTLPVTEDVEEGDTKIYDVSNRHGAHPGDEVRIFDDDEHVIATVAGQGSDDTGDYVVLEEPIEESFEALEGKIRYTDERLHESLGGSKEQLEDYGFEVSNLVLPYGINGPRARELVPEYYDGVPNAEWDGDGLNHYQFLDPYTMHRAYFREGEMTERQLGHYLDGVAAQDVLGLLGGHSAYDSLTADRIRTAIRMAKERNIEILTLREAFADLGVTESEATTEPATTEPSTDPTTTRRSRTTGTRSPPETTVTSTGQSGFGLGTAIAGAGLYAWRRLRA